jgi:LCP family protein required for cell wall assembly
MLSIPRDLLVSIPDRGPGKINTAHVWGEADDYPGGGPGLLKEVIWENLGLQVHRFVRVDLAGFKHVLEIVGGLDMDLSPQPNNPKSALWDDEFPDGHCGVMTINFKPGPQHLTPDQVIQYARSRHSTSDFDRNRRQQEVLVALRARLLQPDMILKAPQLLKEGLDSVAYDFSKREIASLALIAKDIDTSTIAHLQLDGNSLTSGRLEPSGQWILRLVPDEAEKVMRQFQAFQPPPTNTPAPTRDPNATPPPRRRVLPTVEPTPAPAEAQPPAPTEPPTAEPPPPEDPDEDEDN